MAGAHKNELVRIINDDYGIIVKIIHPDYTARRNDVLKFNGYYTWARYGFEGQIPLSSIVFKKFTSILDIMSTANGRKLWKYLGFTFNAKFDLNKDSKNIRMFHRYLEE